MRDFIPVIRDIQVTFRFYHLSKGPHAESM